MTQELTKKEETGLSTQVNKTEAVLKSDVVIPKILLMQGLSKFVQERRAIAGDMVRSNNAEKLGDDKTSVNIIPLAIQNLWMISENANGDGKKYEFRRYEPRTAANETDPWDFIEAGTKWKRTKVMNLYALLPTDIEAQAAEFKKFEETGEMDVDKALLPVVIPFRNTSFKAGKSVATLFAKADSVARTLGKPVPTFGTTVKLSCTQEKNDKGAFFVYTAETAGKTDPKYRAAAASWYDTLTQVDVSQLKVDESDLEEETSSGGSEPQF